MNNKLDKNYTPITDKYFFSDLIYKDNNNTIEKMLSTIKTLSDENRRNWKYYEKNNNKSHIHYAEFTACAEVDVVLNQMIK